MPRAHYKMSAAELVKWARDMETWQALKNPYGPTAKQLSDRMEAELSAKPHAAHFDASFLRRCGVKP
jgi:arsenate reductase-like glutaredoxin family protein